MNVLLLGANGQLGRLLQATAPESVALSPCTREEVDFSRPDLLAQAISTQLERSLQRENALAANDMKPANSQVPARNKTPIRWDHASPVTVINAAAYTLVDAAEKDSATAFAVNAHSPMSLAQLCRNNGWKLIHFSTDYVFDGDDNTGSGDSGDSGVTGNRRGTVNNDHRETPPQRPFRERDPVRPINEYACSKWAGEEAIRQTLAEHLIIRTCGLYSGPFAVDHAVRNRRSGENVAAMPANVASGKGNFVSTILRLGRQNGVVRVVADQHCTPTSALQLAAASWQLIAANATGTFHVTNTGDTTWDEFAREIFRVHNVAASVISISSAEFGAAARRPRYSVLDTTSFTEIVGQPMPHWKDALARSAAEWSTPSK